MAVYPINDLALVSRLGELTGADLDQVISLINTDQESTKKHPFPCPTTYRTALQHYVEITALPRTHILRELAEYCTDENVSWLTTCFYFMSTRPIAIKSLLLEVPDSTQPICRVKHPPSTPVLHFHTHQLPGSRC